MKTNKNHLRHLNLPFTEDQTLDGKKPAFFLQSQTFRRKHNYRDHARVKGNRNKKAGHFDGNDKRHFASTDGNGSDLEI